ncbi:MAG: hypothetical protein FJW30_06150 [Acidobacteria bacterium]|nr:hypothetical protein [Acidobacteriota bacterium]
MTLGTQFSGTVAASSSRRWFTHSWNAAHRVIWMVVPKAPAVDGNPQIEWKVQVDRQAPNLLKYFIEVRNLTGGQVEIEARYAILD